MNDKTIIRKAKNKDNPYVMINKALAQDPALSAKEKGIMFYILSLPDDWEIHVSELVKHFSDGRTAIYGGISGLIDKGYIQRIIHRDATGKVMRYEYIAYEEPIKSTAFQKPENSFPASTNTDLTNNDPDSNKALMKLVVNDRSAMQVQEGLPISDDVWS